jgi:MFS family permease
MNKPNFDWKYDYKEGSTSIHNWYEDMDLMCREKAELGLIGSMNYCGFALVSLFGPRLSDHYGRKKIIMPGILLLLISEALIIFVCRSFDFLLVLMFFFGVSSTGRLSILYLFL